MVAHLPAALEVAATAADVLRALSCAADLKPRADGRGALVLAYELVDVLTLDGRSVVVAIRVFGPGDVQMAQVLGR